MGLKWRHHSRYYISAWENGPYVVYEKSWWRHKRIAQFNQSLQMAIWYVQDLDPNSSVGIVWFPRGVNKAGRPAPGIDTVFTGDDVQSRGNNRIADSDSHGTSKPSHPSVGTGLGTRPACGEIRPGDTVITLAKPTRTKYALRRMNAHGVMEDVS